jgi:hypothetical protein
MLLDGLLPSLLHAGQRLHCMQTAASSVLTLQSFLVRVMLAVPCACSSSVQTVLSVLSTLLLNTANVCGRAVNADCSSLSSHASRRHQPDLQKARALGNTLTLFSTVPWTLCALVYSFLHFTYPRYASCWVASWRAVNSLVVLVWFCLATQLVASKCP